VNDAAPATKDGEQERTVCSMYGLEVSGFLCCYEIPSAMGALEFISDVSIARGVTWDV
jgi:hypothetical protein